MMSDIVFIQGLAVDCIIGVYDWERQVRQRLVFDLDLSFDCKAAALSDDVSDALDYSAVAACITELVEHSEFQLIEALADACFQALFAQFPITQITMVLHKPGAVPTAQSVGLRLTRKRP